MKKTKPKMTSQAQKGRISYFASVILSWVHPSLPTATLSTACWQQAEHCVLHAALSPEDGGDPSPHCPARWSAAAKWCGTAGVCLLTAFFWAETLIYVTLLFQTEQCFFRFLALSSNVVKADQWTQKLFSWQSSHRSLAFSWEAV